MTKSPSVCELLMPSEYGFSCIGSTTESSNCFLKNDRSVRWNNHGGEATLTECILRHDLPLEGIQCCSISKVANLHGFDDCSSLSQNQDLYEECLSQLALKKGRVETCSPIVGTGSRVACQLRAKYKSALRNLPVPLDPENVKQLLPAL
ncbi:MAG: hypothetical protein PHZ00_01510 [Candidatus Peribacteraceae bacterium]|nr:hypothetical protein [Candidatus Peribacteraceae bacterium]